uniref:Cytochrome P450 714C2-like n=1 Tax=Nicotiana tabacum TaxID=4097 RepID=A0A1S3ZAR4_TOBAC|nr:PREDICTED: cytochrome P450 714C2-like [Nicotiana tabacum]
MEFKQFSQVAILLGMVVILIFFVLCKVLYSWLVLPKLKYQKLKENGFEGPAPSFPLGNINEMKKELMNTASSATSSPSLSALKISHDIHSLAFPYFAKWQKLHGKVFIYWLGTEPFVYIADPEFIKKMSAGVMGKSWGKPTVFKRDRKAMFGKGLVMVEGDEWMGWVMNEVLRLYSPAPNVQRQTREDIKVDNVVIPKGTNMWIDLVSMHHDKQLWGEDVNEFKPERFKDDMIHGGCKHKMGYLPFGFGGRMCIGRNLTMMEFKVVLSLILTNFSFSISPNYRHCPSIMLSLRPTQGLPLIFQPL